MALTDLDFKIVDSVEDRVQNIRFRPDMLPGDVRNVKIALSDLYSELRPILGKAERELDRLDRIRRNAEKTIIVSIEEHLPPDVKLTDKTREAHGILFLQKKVIAGLDAPIYDALDRAEDLAARARVVADMIRDRNETVIAIRDMINAEASLV